VIGRGLTGGRRQRHLRTTLVIAEIALSLVLLAGAGLLVSTVSRLLDVDPGFDPSRVISARTWIAVPNNPELDPYRTPAARAGLARRLLERLHEIPEVSAAALATTVPLAQAPPRVPIRAEGAIVDGDAAPAGLIIVSPDYFSVLGIPIVRGRSFAERDDGTVPPVAIIDEAAERTFFPGLDAVGRRLQIGRAGPQGPPPFLTVVGVVKTAKHDRLDEPVTPHVYASLYQRSGRSLNVIVKTRAAVAGLEESLRRAVTAADADLPVFAMASLDETIDQSISRQRFAARALGVFAGLALALVIGGVYGVMAYAVTMRTQEIGVRLAMGASPDLVLRGVLVDALRIAVSGVAIGVILASLSTQLIRTMLFGVSSGEPRVLVAASLALITATLLASYLPARRAARVDPLVSLRYE
jgi:putative ABC transport system permease protein